MINLKTIFGASLALGITMSATLAQTSPPVQVPANVVNLCAGDSGGVYAQAGDIIAGMAKNSSIKINVIKDTGGTYGNIERLQNGTCNAFLGQPDGWTFVARRDGGLAARIVPVADLHREFLHVLCGRDSGITALEDLASNPTKYSVALGNVGSGAWLTWQNFVEYDKRLKDVATKNEAGNVALAAVATKRTTCALVPSGLGGKTMLTANEDFGAKLKLVEATSKHFVAAQTPDKKPLYEFAEIPSKFYKNIQDGFWSSSVKTVSWETMVYVDQNMDDKTQSALIGILMKSSANIKNQFGR